MTQIKFMVQLGFVVQALLGFSGFVASQRLAQEPSLVARYDKGSSLFRVIEDLQKLDDLNKDAVDPQIGLRICSDERLSRSFALASVSLQQIVEYLSSNVGYDRPSIFILRSSECTRGPARDFVATEIWAFDKGSKPPANEESYSVANVEFGSFGFDPLECPRSSASNDRQRFLAEMKIPGTYGAVIGYYLDKPRNVLKTNIEKATRLLIRNKIAESRYIVGSQPWHDGASGCSDVEPTRPMLITIRIRSAAAVKTPPRRSGERGHGGGGGGGLSLRQKDGNGPAYKRTVTQKYYKHVRAIFYSGSERENDEN